LLGKPLIGAAVDGTMRVDQPVVSAFDYTKQPPFELAFSGVVANAPPAKVFREDRFRVSVFPETGQERCTGCGRDLCWLVMELRCGRRWLHLLTVHETNIPVMTSVLDGVNRYLDALTADAEERK